MHIYDPEAIKPLANSIITSACDIICEVHARN